jgi:hypothetical protein
MLKRLILALALARTPVAAAEADTLTAGQTKAVLSNGRRQVAKNILNPSNGHH